MGLSPQQLAAVQAKEPRVLVLAGAGSGKTRVLIERIAHLIEHEHVSPYELYCNTFTRKAGQEIKDRLELRIGKKAHNILAGTMHATALKMLQRFGESIGLKPNSITVYGEFESEFLLSEVAKELGVLRGKTWKTPKKGVQKLFSDFYDRCVDPDELDPASPLFYAFLQRCRENNALSYDMLLVALEVLIPALKQHLHIKRILVDECQDYTLRQWRIVNKMCEAFGASLFAVGDTDQSIYAFRNALPEYLVEHQHEFTICHLATNYRSVPEIVEASNRLISHNTKRIDKTMLASRGTGTHVGVDIVMGQDSAAIAEDLTFWEPAEISKTAVLCRNHKLLQRLSEELTARNVDHQYIGRKSSLVRSEEFSKFHAFLKLIVNPHDNFSFMLIRDLIGVTPEEYAEIRVRAAAWGLSHFQGWMDDLKPPDEYCRFFTSMKSLESLAGAAFQIKYMATGAEPYPETGWPFNVEEIFKFILSWAAENPNGTIKQYLSWLATYDLQDELGDRAEGLTLMTIHAAKGLEFPTVIVAGVNEGIIPSKQAISAGEIEEERRSMYVAMTRAKDQLVLCVRPERVERDGRIHESPTSRFVGEIYG